VSVTYAEWLGMPPVKPVQEPGELYCATCERSYPSGERCPKDGSRLVRIHRPDPLIGRELDARYTIVERLGQGGMGAIYRAVQRSISRDVAIKVMNSAVGMNPDLIKRFLREAKLASQLTHPNVVTVLDCGETDDGIFYLVMELVAGRTLADILASEKRLPGARIVRIGTQICEALDSAHALSIVHRDLKPTNIMVLSRGRDLVKLLDFGLAKSLAPEVARTMTGLGEMLGTPAFMPPELANGLPCDSRADLYSLGCILYLCGTGELPFKSESVNELIAMHGIDKAPAMTGVPPALARIIDRLLEKSPADRYQSAAETRDALEQCLEPVGGVTPHGRSEVATEVIAGRPTSRSRRGRLAAGIVLALAGLAGVGATFAMEDDVPDELLPIGAGVALVGAVVAATGRRRDRTAEALESAAAPREPVVQITTPEQPKPAPTPVVQATQPPSAAPPPAAAKPDPVPDPTPLPTPRPASERPSSEVAVIVDVPISAPTEEERNARLAKLPLQLDFTQPPSKPTPPKSALPAARPTPSTPARPRAASHPESVETAPTELAVTDTDVGNEPTAVRAVEVPRPSAMSEESAITAIVVVPDKPTADPHADTLPPESSEAAKAEATSLPAPRNTDRGHAQTLKKPAPSAATPAPAVPPAPPLLPSRAARASKPVAAPLKPAPTPKPAAAPPIVAPQAAPGPAERPSPMPVAPQRSSKTTIPPAKTTVGTPIPPRVPNAPGSKSEPGKLGPAKLEPAKLEPAKPEPAKPDAAKPEPAKPEPARPDKPDVDDDEAAVSTAVREVVAPPDDAPRMHSDTDNTGLEGDHELPNDPTLVTPMEITGIPAQPAAPPVALPPPPKPLPPGARRLGAYVVLASIGRTPDGPIYPSHDDARDRDVHVETLPSDLDLVTFAALVQTLANIEHANLVRAHELVLHAGKPYLVREPHANRTLEDIVKERGALPWLEAVNLIDGVCAGLERLHERGVVHGAVRPGCIFVDGKACKLGGVGVPPSLFHRIGLAPEGGTSRRRDVYGVGATLYYCLTTSTPSAGAPIPDIFPAKLVALTSAMIAENPTDRPTSIQDVRAKFRALTA
jgi:serine/threonine protein kinase